MSILLALVLLAGVSDRTSVAGENGAVEVFRCNFGEPSDRNYDGWPDGWTRRHGAGFPQYVAIKIAEGPSPAVGRCLRVDLDGGGATAYSPPVPIDSRSNLLLDARVNAENLKYDRAWISLRFFNGKQQQLTTVRSGRVGATAGWEKLGLGPVAPPPDAKTAIIGLHLEPEAEEQDLHGTARFADLRLLQLPRMTLAMRRGAGANAGPGRHDALAAHLFTDPSHIEITCIVSGLHDPPAQVNFHLEDLARRELSCQAMPSGKAVWQPPIPGPGFYRVRAALTAKGSEIAHSMLTLAVLEPSSQPGLGQNRSDGSDFGWGLPRGDKPLSLPELGDLLSQAGIHWVKYPMGWDGREASARLEPLAVFSGRLAEQGMEIVGQLGGSVQQTGVDAGTADNPKFQISNPFLADPKTWYPALEPIMARLAAQVRWWQVGSDRDSTLPGVENIGAKVAQVKKALDQVGQGVNMGVAWNWTQPPPKTENAPSWQFLALAADARTTERELAKRLDATRTAGIRRWVTLEGLPKDAHSPEARAEHLAKQIIAAKLHGAEAVFFADPFDPRRGLMNEDGTVGDLFLPWRTSALVLGGAKCLGSLDLPGGSANHVFARPSEVVMVLWSQQAVEETVYLGGTVRQLDLWGRPCSAAVPAAPRVIVPVALVDPAVETPAPRAIRVDAQPTFLVGLSEPLVRWQLAATLGCNELPSIPNQRRANSLRLKNRFSHAVTGRAVLTPPEGWRLEPRVIEFGLAKDEGGAWPLDIVLPPNVIGGPQRVRIDFEIRTDRVHCFSVWRQITVGLGDVLLEAAMRLNPRGDLEVQQTLVNQGKQAVSFRCALIAPDRCREGTQVLGLKAGRDIKTYQLPRGEELLGKTLWLRAEEIDGPRVVNCRLVPGQP
jgi:hypothetical protein